MNKVTLTYYYDALCGWCFGISHIMGKIQQQYRDQINIEVLSGGLFVGNRAGLINEVAPHICQGAYLSVEQATGMKFGQAFLEGPLKSGDMRLNSLPPAIALCIVKEMAPQKSLQFSSLMNKAFYVDGRSPEDLETYTFCAKECGISVDAFETKMKDSAYSDRAQAEFEYVSDQQVDSYPTLRLTIAGKEYPLTNGEYSYEKIVATIDSLLAVGANH